MLWGQSYVLPMTWGGGGIWGPLSVDMQPYGCFIAYLILTRITSPGKIEYQLNNGNSK